jgi:microcystin degradation protein MlrC
LYTRLAELDQVRGIMNASLLVGCAWTDSVHTPMSVIVVAETERELAQQQAKRFAREVWARRQDFNFGVETATIDEAIQRAMDAPERPIFISDSGDNVTAGAPGDVPLFVERLLALGAQDALVAGLADPEAIRRCIAAGKGAEVTLSLGGKLDPVTSKPLPVTGQVQHLSVGPGEHPEEPTIATVEVEGIQIVLAVDHRPFIDRATIAAAGVDSMQQKIVVVKQGYLFPDLADHAARAIMALSPGATNLRLEELPYRQLPRPVFPLDPELMWEP